MRALAALLAALLVAPMVRAEPTSTAPFVHQATAPSPPIFVKLPWLYGASSTQGYWYTADQIVRVQAQMDYLTDRAAQDCTAATIAADKSFLLGPAALWLGLGTGLLVGGAAGLFVAKKFNP